MATATPPSSSTDASNSTDAYLPTDSITYEDLYSRWERGNWSAMELDFTEDSGRLIAVKVAANDPFARASGILGCRRSSDEIVREVRGDPDAV